MRCIEIARLTLAVLTGMALWLLAAFAADWARGFQAGAP